MSIADKYTLLNTEKIPAVHEAGKKAEWSEFWLSAMRGTDWRYRFSGNSWTDSTFKPTGDIVPVGNGTALFGYMLVSNLKQRLLDCGVSLDLSEVTNATTMFAYSLELTKVPALNFSTSCTTISTIFRNCRKLQRIDELHMHSSMSLTTNAFENCEALTDLTIVGTIGVNNFNVQWSPLSHDSLMSIINALETKTSGTWTLTLGETNMAKLTTDELRIAEAKGWNLA